MDGQRRAFICTVALRARVSPPTDRPLINLSIGEPQHPTPPRVHQALIAALDGTARYPATRGLPELRTAIGLLRVGQKVQLDVLRGHCAREGRAFADIEKTLLYMGPIPRPSDHARFVAEMRDYAAVDAWPWLLSPDRRARVDDAAGPARPRPRRAPGPARGRGAMGRT